ncbi:MAG: flippase-like domain-containing protein [Oleiphilaceae bacterium]|nr:flippase-like domain-containing protein [Oleiphilaceae bacterium]
MAVIRRFGPRSQLVLRWLVTLIILGLVVYVLDIDSLLNQLGRIGAGTIVSCLVITLAQVGLSAWRWRYTSRRLGLRLGMVPAIREYYLATFINQLLPGGVMGDVNRAWRQSRDTEQKLAAANAVVIERFSGQLVLVLIAALLVAGFWPFSGPVPGTHQSGDNNGSLLLPGLLVATAVVALAVWRKPLLRYLGHLGKDIRLALLSWPAFGVQVVTSAIILATYLAVFLLLAAGLNGEGVAMPADWRPLLALCAGLLLAMSLPLTVAGWGVREGVAILLWPMAGLPAEEGAVLSVAYGLLVLVSSLPGACALLAGPFSVRRERASGPDRTTYPSQD